MKLIKIFIAFTFLLAFSVCASAQSNQYPNEIEGYKFFNDGKLKTLKLLFSTKDDVKVIFGEQCNNSCDYNEDWNIQFTYIHKDWSQKYISSGSDRLYKPKPEFIGKLAQVSLRPKKTILLSESLLIPDELHCRSRTAFENPRYKIRVCSDFERVIYRISDETTADKKVSKGQVISITYLPSEKDEDDMYSLVNQK